MRKRVKAVLRRLRRRYPGFVRRASRSRLGQRLRPIVLGRSVDGARPAGAAPGLSPGVPTAIRFVPADTWHPKTLLLGFTHLSEPLVAARVRIRLSTSDRQVLANRRMGTLAEHLATSQPFAELLGPGLAHWVAIHVDDLPQDVSKMDVALHYEDKDQVLQTIPEGFAATALLIEQLQGSGEQYSLLDLATARPTRVQTI